MVRDRGRIKWNSLMLPEHVKLLKEYNKNLKRIEKPDLDEQKYDEFNEIICRAIEENITLEFTYYQKGEVKKLTGNINNIDGLNRKIEILSSASNTHMLRLDNILEIEMII